MSVTLIAKINKEKVKDRYIVLNLSDHDWIFLKDLWIQIGQCIENDIDQYSIYEIGNAFLKCISESIEKFIIGFNDMSNEIDEVSFNKNNEVVRNIKFVDKDKIRLEIEKMRALISECVDKGYDIQFVGD